MGIMDLSIMSCFDFAHRLRAVHLEAHGVPLGSEQRAAVDVHEALGVTPSGLDQASEQALLQHVAEIVVDSSSLSRTSSRTAFSTTVRPVEAA